MPSAQEIMMGSRVAHVRELKAEIERLKAENARLGAENAELKAHFELALLAAAELRELAGDRTARFVIVDGWNLILGANREAASPEALVAQIREERSRRPQDFFWIVFDGPRESCRVENRLRISYTGGTGAHRADRFICDFVRMAKFLGLADVIEVRTHDKDFLSQVRRIVSR